MGSREMRRQDATRSPGQAEGLGTTDEATTTVARRGEPGRRRRKASRGRGRSCLALLSVSWERSTQSCAKTCLQ